MYTRASSNSGPIPIVSVTDSAGSGSIGGGGMSGSIFQNPFPRLYALHVQGLFVKDTEFSFLCIYVWLRI